MTSRTAASIRQTQPFSGPEEHAFIALQRLASQHLQAASDLLRPDGLTVTQYNVLRILRGAEPRGLSCVDIAERLVTRDPDMTRLLNRLLKLGLVSRSREEADQRVVINRITGAGMALVEAIRGPLEALHRAQFGHLPAERLQALIELLEDAAEAAPAEG